MKLFVPPIPALRRVALSAAAAAALLVHPPVARGQTVQGIVVDESTKKPIGGARLALLSDSAIAVAQTVADSSTGMFYLSAPAKGQYRLQIVVGRGGLVTSPAFDLDSAQVIEHLYEVPPFPKAVLEAYLPEDVTRRAHYQRHLDVPRYPDRLRARGVDGILRALVVVDSTGRPDPATFRVLESPDPNFTYAVRSVLPGWRFSPAERDGVRVAEVIPISIDFGFDPEPSRLRPDERSFGIVIRALPVGRTIPITPMP